MSQKETREQLLAALTACIERAPDKASEPLLRAYKAFVAARVHRMIGAHVPIGLGMCNASTLCFLRRE